MISISLVTLGVHDLARATRFYEALGWRRSSASTPEVTFFHGATAVLALWGAADLARDAGLGLSEAPSPSGSVSLAVNLADEAAVDALLDTAGRAGGRVTKPARATDWGGYSGSFADPDGHLWEVAHNPFFTLAPDGHITLPDGP